MSSIAEQCWVAIFARLTASTFPGVPASSIRRYHRTNVTRENAPAIHLIEGMAKPTEDKRCDWRWEMAGTIAVFVREDRGYTAADPIVVEILKRINPEITPFYPTGMNLELLRIGPNTEIADTDATRVDIDVEFKFGTALWAIDAAAT